MEVSSSEEPVQGDEWDLSKRVRGELRPASGGRGDDEPIDAASHHDLDFRQFFFRTFIRGGDEDGIAVRTSDSVDALRDVGVEGVVQERDDQADRFYLRSA